MKNIIKCTLSFIFVFGLSALGAWGSNPMMNEWYQSLTLPSFNPPSFIFGIVWPILYVLIATSLFLIWKQKEGWLEKGRSLTLWIFVVHVLLNVVWSPVFFGLQSIGGALILLILILGTLLWLMKRLYKKYRVSAYLLLPYLLWIMFALVLNISIFFLN